MSQLLTVQREKPSVDFEQTVPRSLVHRRSVSEVFVTDLIQLSDTTVEVGAQWPRDHSFYRLRSAGHHDPLLFAECIRQAGLAIAHRVFGVPMHWAFLTRRHDYWIDPAGLSRAASPVDILLSVDCRDIKQTRRGVTGMVMDMVLYRDSEPVGGGLVDWSCVSPASYARLRQASLAPVTRESLPDPVAPGLVGRERDWDVVLAPGRDSNSWELRINQEHAVLFDHFVDHVPGMVLMEAARQATILHGRGAETLPVDSRFTFHHYVELGEPTTVHLTPGGDGAGPRTVHVEFVQGGRCMATGDIGLLEL